MNRKDSDENTCAAHFNSAVTDLPEGIIAIGLKDSVIRNKKYIGIVQDA